MAKEALKESVIMPAKFPYLFTGMYGGEERESCVTYEMGGPGERVEYLCMSFLNLHSHQVFVL